MTTRSRRGGAVLAVVLASLAMAGCRGGDDGPPRAGPELSGFEEQTSTQNRLPAEFPRSLPLPGDRRVLYSAVSNLGLSAYFDAADSAAALKDFFLRKLPDAGWALRSCQVIARSPEPVTILTAGRDGTTATVTVGYHPDYATRLDGRRYDFFVALAFRSQAQAPETAPAAC